MTEYMDELAKLEDQLKTAREMARAEREVARAEHTALEERVAFAEQARDNAVAQRDVVIERSKAKAQTAGRIISQLKALVHRCCKEPIEVAVVDVIVDEILGEQPATPALPTHPCSQCCAPFYEDGRPAFDDHPGARERAGAPPESSTKDRRDGEPLRSRGDS